MIFSGKGRSVVWTRLRQDKKDQKGKRNFFLDWSLTVWIEKKIKLKLSLRSGWVLALKRKQQQLPMRGRPLSLEQRQRRVNETNHSQFQFEQKPKVLDKQKDWKVVSKNPQAHPSNLVLLNMNLKSFTFETGRSQDG